MANHKASAQQMAQAGEYLITVAGKINSTLTSINNRLNAIKNAAGKLDSYNGQPVEGREDIAEYKSSYNYTKKVGEDEYVYRVTTYKVFDEVWNISGQSVAQMEAEKLGQQMNANIKKIVSTLQKYSIQVKGNAQALALKQKKINAILNNKEFKEYFQKNIFYNKYDVARGNNGANVTSKTFPYWIDKNLKFVKQDNGAWLITKNGIAMGFTTGGAVAAYQKYRASKDIKENKKSSPVTLSEAEYKKLQEARKKEAEGRAKQQEAEARKIRAQKETGAAATTKQSSSGKLSDKEMKELQEARKKEAEGRAKQQEAEARKIRAQKETGVAAKTKDANNIPNSTFTAKPIPSSERAIDFAKKVANDNNIGYVFGGKGGTAYDCSSFVIDAYQNAGVDVKGEGASYTGNMIDAFQKTGKFEYISGNPNVEDLKPGDVVITPGSHTEMYIGNGKLIGARDDFDGRAGDSSGNEISIKDYYGTWSGYLKFKGN